MSGSFSEWQQLIQVLVLDNCSLGFFFIDDTYTVNLKLATKHGFQSRYSL